MSWTYNGDPSSSEIEEIRFLIADTDVNNQLMQDEEIQYLIDTYGTKSNRLYYQVFDRAATLFSRDVKRKLGPQEEDPTTRLTFYKEKAQEYQRLVKAAGISVPTYAYPKIFKKGMQSNPPNRDGEEYV
jgi:hypothetical protein